MDAINKEAFEDFKAAAEKVANDGQLRLAFQWLAQLANQFQGVDIFGKQSGTSTRINLGKDMLVTLDFSEGRQSVLIEGNFKSPAAIPNGSNSLRVVIV